MAPPIHFATVVGVFLATAAFRISHASAQQSDSHSSHESAVFGHAALYSMEAGVSNIVAIIASEEGDSFEHEEEYLAFMLVPAATASDGGLEEAEEAAEAAWESFISGAEEPTVPTTEEPVTPSETNVYQIALADPLVLVPVDLADAGAYALFLEHGDTDEVQVVVTSPSGAVLVAVVEEEGEHDVGDHHDDEEDHHDDEEDHHDDEEDLDEDASLATGKQWANALAAAAIVSACSFVGLLVMMTGRVAQSIDLSHACIFASGALLTASLMHIIPEALESLQSKYEDNLHGLGLHAGLSLLVGITFGVVVHALLASSHSHSHSHVYPQHNQRIPTTTIAGDSKSAADLTCTPISCALGVTPDGAKAPVGGGGGAGGVTQTGFQNFRSQALTAPASLASATENGAGSAVSLQALIKQRSGKALLDVGSLQSVCWTVIIGDLVHNFADGLTIGAAFLGCSPTVGWTVTASAIIHEVPHELADFMALIKGGMSARQAAVYNFVSALSAVAGVVLILALRDALTSAQISSILLVGAGSFLFIALSELIPEALEVHPGASAGEKRRCARLPGA